MVTFVFSNTGNRDYLWLVVISWYCNSVLFLFALQVYEQNKLSKEISSLIIYKDTLCNQMFCTLYSALVPDAFFVAIILC